MSDSARLYAYKALFEAKRLVTRADMMEVAEVSLATFKRDIAKLRDQMGMPILFDKDRGGYFLGPQQSVDRNAGLWFNPEELVALLTIQRLIEQLEPGLVGLKLRPLQKKLTDLLEAKGLGEAEIAKRVRMTFAGKRQLELKAFEQVALATISRKQVKVTHLSRERAERVERTISPQELGALPRQLVHRRLVSPSQGHSQFRPGCHRRACRFWISLRMKWTRLNFAA
jgi:predicted DNA-binding transcriptional regulator YafY